MVHRKARQNLPHSSSSKRWHRGKALNVCPHLGVLFCIFLCLRGKQHFDGTRLPRHASTATPFYQALGSVYEGTMPFLRKTVDLGCKAVDAGAGGRGMDAFKRLAGDFGEFVQTPVNLFKPRESRKATTGRTARRGREKPREWSYSSVEAAGACRLLVMKKHAQQERNINIVEFRQTKQLESSNASEKESTHGRQRLVKSCP